MTRGRASMTDADARAVQARFEPQRLLTARLSRRLRKSELADLVGLTPAAVGQYENGRARPSSASIVRIALALGFPLGYFEGGRPIAPLAEERTHFRRLRSTSRMERAAAAAQVAIVEEFVQYLERHVELPEVAIPDLGAPISSHANAEHLANEVRRLWGLGAGPIDQMTRLLELHGCVVLRIEVGDRGIDAFSRWTSLRPVIVLSNDKGDAARSRFDAAHELGHLLMHHDPEPGNPIVEEQAQAFAAAFLMPAETILAELPRRVDWQTYFALKVRWRVSLQALLYRARTVGAVSEPAYKRAMVRMSANDWRRNEPVDLGPAEEPTVMQEAVRLICDARGILPERLIYEARLPFDLMASLTSLTPEPKPRVDPLRA